MSPRSIHEADLRIQELEVALAETTEMLLKRQADDRLMADMFVIQRRGVPRMDNPVNWVTCSHPYTGEEVVDALITVVQRSQGDPIRIALYTGGEYECCGGVHPD